MPSVITVSSAKPKLVVVVTSAAPLPWQFAGLHRRLREAPRERPRGRALRLGRGRQRLAVRGHGREPIVKAARSEQQQGAARRHAAHDAPRSHESHVRDIYAGPRMNQIIWSSRPRSRYRFMKPDASTVVGYDSQLGAARKELEHATGRRSSRRPARVRSRRRSPPRRRSSRAARVRGSCRART